MRAAEPCRRKQRGLIRRGPVERRGRGELRQRLHRLARDALTVGPAESLGEKFYRFRRTGQTIGIRHEVFEHRDSRLPFARQRPQHVEAHHVARAFPDRVHRRLAIVTSQNVLLDVAVAARHSIASYRKPGALLQIQYFTAGVSSRIHAAAFASVGASSNARHSRITSAIDASTCSAMSASTLCING